MARPCALPPQGPAPSLTEQPQFLCMVASSHHPDPGRGEAHMAPSLPSPQYPQPAQIPEDIYPLTYTCSFPPSIPIPACIPIPTHTNVLALTQPQRWHRPQQDPGQARLIPAQAEQAGSGATQGRSGHEAGVNMCGGVNMKWQRRWCCPGSSGHAACRLGFGGLEMRHLFSQLHSYVYYGIQSCYRLLLPSSSPASPSLCPRSGAWAES